MEKCGGRCGWFERDWEFLCSDALKRRRAVIEAELPWASVEEGGEARLKLSSHLASPAPKLRPACPRTLLPGCSSACRGPIDLLLPRKRQSRRHIHWSSVMPHTVQYCGYQSSKAAYAGAIATMDIYAFPNLKKGEQIAAQIWVADGNSQTQVMSGWEVNPEQYGDSKTHFYIYWTTNKKDGCANLDCVGFVPVSLATITPGDTLEPSSGQISITLKILKSKEDGDWWLHFGHDINNLKPVGYWPKSLLVNMQDHAGIITWGGTADSYNGEVSPPMGNGKWPGNNSAASFQNVQYVDINGQGYDPSWDSLHNVETHKKCYRTGVFRLGVQGNMFYYGGPGGCTS